VQIVLQEIFRFPLDAVADCHNDLALVNTCGGRLIGVRGGFLLRAGASSGPDLTCRQRLKPPPEAFAVPFHETAKMLGPELSTSSIQL
jgi:hypothetical protein